MPMKIQPLARFSKNKITHCDVLNIDDIGECFVNGVLAKKVSGGKDSGWIDITSYLTKPSNSVYFRLTNKIKGWAYGFQIRKNGIVFWPDECGKTGSRGCKNEDRTKGVVFEKKLTVTLYPKPIYPPMLSANVRFSEPSGNRFLDAEEQGKLIIQLTNNGKGSAYGVQIQIRDQTSDRHLSYRTPKEIEEIPAYTSKTVEIPVAADFDVESHTVTFEIKILEANGFDADPVQVSFETRAFVPPALALTDVGIDDDQIGDSYGNSNGKIEPGESIEATAIIQNRGQGDAENVQTTIKVTDSNIFYTGKERFNLGDLSPGDYEAIAFSFTVNKRFSGTDLPIAIRNYLEQTFGYKAGNILRYSDATKTDFQALFGSNTDHKGKLYRKTRTGGEVFIYYSGHGHSEGQNKPSYFVPADAEVSTIGLTGYPLKVFYDNIAKLIAEKHPKRVVVVIESCFSGYLAEGISSTRWVSENPLVTWKTSGAVVMTAASGSETAKWYKAKQHGLFTYFLLKAFQNSPNEDGKRADANGDGRLTLSEIQAFVGNRNYGVPYFAPLHTGDDQTPVIMGDKSTVLLEW